MFEIGQQSTLPTQLAPSSRTLYIVLAILFGPLGFHDFYIGKFGLGALKIIALLLMLVAEPLFFAALFVALYLLGLIQAFTVRHDSKGTPLA
ncbi:TM2 domain-containing protein [Stenotrophomonas sp. SY1]|uniref:TM2 domain-containing protein n=1 Tax=Stenotrophomonas sp. SY1 TaxID=477235 RepID=UPI001E406FAC|nr:TM2 domain-containing protein [Stenotrophomonas sp. SY1]MCD9086218.1 TM2 domain-containing protein [Stenotrophomonas sp. SY1]